MRIVLIVAIVALLDATVICAALAPSASHVIVTASLQQSGHRSAQARIQTFLGTITKAGNRFVFTEDVSRNFYQLDDQETASKFDGKKVKVTGTLDATNDIIRVQNIEATA